MVLAGDIWGPIGAAFGFLAIVIGGTFAWWFARGPRLVMQVSGSTLVSTPTDHRIAVTYEGGAVPRVTQSLVWLWREGRGTVRASDVVPTDPIVLRVPEGERILNIAVLAQTKPSNDVTTVLYDSEDAALVRFQYLDPRQVALIELLHTASSPEAVEAAGAIIGVPKGIVRVTSGVEVIVPLSIAGPTVSVTVPTHTIPRSLRTASGTRTTRPSESLSDRIATGIRILLR